MCSLGVCGQEMPPIAAVVEPKWTEPDWAGLDWTGLDWAGWTGWGWLGEGCTVLRWGLGSLSS